MSTHRFSRCIIAALSVLVLASCNGRVLQDDLKDRETMFQVATLQSLMVGNYDGFLGIGDLKRYGDIGLGTFDRANGEMVVLDGNVYQALGDGTVRIADDNETTPFATVTWFDADISRELSPFEDLPSLTRQLDSIVFEHGRNFIYALHMDVDARIVSFRSELPQEKPYGPLSKVLPNKLRSFTLENITGTVVAVCFPSFFTGQNTPGWHFHFLTSDRKQGGHVTDISSSGFSTALLDVTGGFHMFLPDDPSFRECDLSDDMAEDIDMTEH